MADAVIEAFFYCDGIAPFQRHLAGSAEESSMAWAGIVGKSFAPDDFEKYIGTVTFNVWRPRFVVVHNTSVPNRSTWDGWQTRNPPITDEKWAKNLEGFYKG